MPSAEGARSRAWRGPVPRPLPAPGAAREGGPAAGQGGYRTPRGGTGAPPLPQPHTPPALPQREAAACPQPARPAPPGPRGPHPPRRARPWWPWPQGGREGRRQPLSVPSPPPPRRCRPLCPPPRQQQRRPRRRLRPPEMGLRRAVTARPRLLPGRHRHRRHHRHCRHRRHGPAGVVASQARPRGRRHCALLQVATVATVPGRGAGTAGWAGPRVGLGALGSPGDLEGIQVL